MIVNNHDQINTQKRIKWIKVYYKAELANWTATMKLAALKKQVFTKNIKQNSTKNVGYR